MGLTNMDRVKSAVNERVTRAGAALFLARGEMEELLNKKITK
jgi:hypothetical protein